jgi:hypothetical protein
MIFSFRIAQATGVNLMDLDCLLTGEVTANVANRFNMPIEPLESFIRGNAADYRIANLIRGTMQDAVDLRTQIGREGAIGLLIGMMLANK